MSTFYVKNSELPEKQWQVIDARGQVVGRLAARISRILMGKTRTDYTPHVETGDGVIVINAGDIVVTGTKVKTKTYKNFSGYPSGQRVRTFERVMAEDPTFPLKSAVKGMLPKTRLGRRMLTRLLLYTKGTHPHQAQVNKSTAPKDKKKK